MPVTSTVSASRPTSGVCAEKLIGAQEFTDEELADPNLSDVAADMLSGDAPARNPCLRRGPLSLAYWTRLPGQGTQRARSIYR
jgi:hypothetical protein